MKLLLPVDGSSASMNAVKKAIEIANKDGLSIKLITVIRDNSQGSKRNENLWRQVDGSIISGNARTMNNDDTTSKAKDNADELLNSIVDEFDFGNIKVEKDVLVGEPYDKILETAENEKFDLIVMGNRGFSKIKRFFTGSVTQRVISEATCPVLVIHADAED